MQPEEAEYLTICVHIISHLIDGMFKCFLSMCPFFLSQNLWNTFGLWTKSFVGKRQAATSSVTLRLDTLRKRQAAFISEAHPNWANGAGWADVEQGGCGEWKRPCQIGSLVLQFNCSEEGVEQGTKNRCIFSSP